jgi:hypothetical protein
VAPLQTLAARLDALRAQGLDRLRAGDLDGAHAAADAACALLADGADRAELDRWLCNRAAIAIELRRGAAELAPLREVLMRNGGGELAWQAAYHLARHYEWEKNFRKSLFYAQIATDRAAELGDAERLRGSRNLLGNALLGLSRAAEAAAAYRDGLAAAGREDAERGVLLGNLGYCEVLAGRLRAGRSLLLQSLRRVRGARPLYELRTRLDLSFAALEATRYGCAARHGRLALAMARALGDLDATKNALYLLGEAAQLAGDAERARATFAALQSEFFPGQPYLAGFLMAFDVRRVVNLHA